MNNRIKIYAIVLAIVYVCMVAFHLQRAIEPSMAGFEQGFAQADSRDTKGMASTFHVRVKPSSGLYSFPTSMTVEGKETGAMLELDRVKVRQTVDESHMPDGYMIYFIFKTLISFVVFGYFVYIPFLFFRIVHSVAKGKIFDASVLRRLKKIGLIVVGYYIISVAFEATEVYFNQQMVDIENYNVIFTMPNFIPLMFGLVILFLGEILKMSLTMKEEQDLTI